MLCMPLVWGKEPELEERGKGKKSVRPALQGFTYSGSHAVSEPITESHEEDSSSDSAIDPSSSFATGSLHSTQDAF